MRILYVGPDSGTSGQRAAAIRRLGHEVRILDPYSMLPPNRVAAFWIWHTGALGLIEFVRRRAIESLGDANFDVAWVDHGSLVGPGLVRDLKARTPIVLCYNVDDPFGSRDGMRWREYRKAVPFYDLLVVVRAPNVQEAYRLGARRVMHVFFSADEVAHAPRQLTTAEYEQWRSEVVFVGTAFPERGPFFAELVRLGVPLTIYGNRFDRLREWPLLKPYWRPASTGTVDGYANAICAAKVSLGLLSKGNRDLHTTRSLEIPSLGGVFCAERTPEHAALYEEDREAVFWTDAEECAAKCHALLINDAWRHSIAAHGRQRYLDSPWQNMRVVQSVLDAALNRAAPPATSFSLDSGHLTTSLQADFGETATVPAIETHAD
jgi:spore maturation protein CgeB